MWYLITQILFCLLIAALIGFFIGWLLRRLIGLKREWALEEKWAARVSKLEAERDDLSARLASRRSNSAAASASRGAASRTSDYGTVGRAGQVEQQRHELRTRPASLDSEAGTAATTPSYGIKALKPGLASAIKPRMLSGPGGEPDDLKQISGVGPKIEKKLNNLGVYHFRQIADFTAENVAWVDEYLIFKGRIQREGWVEQAKELAAGRQTEFSRRYLVKKRR